MAIANVELTNTFDEWRTKTNQLIVQSDQIALITANTAANVGIAYNLAVASYGQANTANATAVAAFAQANVSNTVANAAFTKANLTSNIAVAAFLQANTGNTTAIAAFLQANTANATAIGAFGQANTALTLAQGATSNLASIVPNRANNLSGGTTGQLHYQTGVNTTGFLGTGTSGQALVTKGAAAPVWTDIIPAGTIMLFVQTAAPTGWTKSITHNDKALRIVSGSVSSGGSLAFSTAFASRSSSGTTGSTAVSGSMSSTTISGSIGSTTLDETQIPNHKHFTFVSGITSDVNAAIVSGTNSPLRRLDDGTSSRNYDIKGSTSDPTIGLTSAVGGGLGHTHAFYGDSHGHTFYGDAHTHSFSSSLDMTVQYVDAIIATKDAY